jgi:hypothetical protein
MTIRVPGKLNSERDNGNTGNTPTLIPYFPETSFCRVMFPLENRSGNSGNITEVSLNVPTSNGLE